MGLMDGNEKLENKALLSIKEMCMYLSIGQTKCRELLSNASPYVLAIACMRIKSIWISGLKLKLTSGAIKM